MLKDFLGFINQNELCDSKSRILVAVSGGKDSIALLMLFIEAKFNVAVAHYNFGLRGRASDGDEEFVKQVCIENNIPFFSKKTNTKEATKDWGVSTQMAARELRYNWFRELIVTEGYDYLATAHNLDDKIETLYLNITKGTGPRGLKSIPLKKGNIIRPLMFAGVSDIMKYLSDHNIVWREDSSNQTVDYQRNKIRHQVIPVLREINQGIENTAQINFKRFDALNQIFEEKLKEFKQTVTYEEVITIPFEKWKNSPGFSLVAEEFLKEFGFNYQEVNDLLNVTISGKIISSATHTVSMGRSEWFLEEKKKTENQTIEITEPGIYKFGNQQVELLLTKDFPSIMELRKSDIGYFDYDILKWPLTLRTWQLGDKFQPFGMRGKKLVSDFLIDAKIETTEKKNQLVLLDDNHIVWLVRLRIDDKYKLHSATKNILKVSFLK